MSDWQKMLETDVLTLGMAADDRRRALPSGGVVTYVRVQPVSLQELRTGVDAAEAASEIRCYETPETFADALAAVRALRALAGSRRVAAFSLAELESRRWDRFPEALKALVEAGLQDVAELPADRLDDLGAALRLLRDAGAEPERVTVAWPLGDRRVDVIRRVERALAEHPAVRRFSPLPRVAPSDTPTTGYDDVRMVATARLALGDASIEVDWSLHGPKLAQVALTFGADHLDAVPVSDDSALGRRRTTVEEVERNIRAAGFEPQEIRARGARD